MKYNNNNKYEINMIERSNDHDLDEMFQLCESSDHH